MCVLQGSSTYAYIVKLGQFDACIFGKQLEPSLHGSMQPSEKTRLERSQGWCGRTRPHPGLLRQPLPCSSGLLVGPGLLPRRCPTQVQRVGGLLLVSFALFCFTLSLVTPFDHFSMYLVYMSCKTLSIQYIWKYINSKCICVESLFISPVLDINWRSDLIINDRQQIPQA